MYLLHAALYFYCDKNQETMLELILEKNLCASKLNPNNKDFEKVLGP